jgi:hypothetical protein
MSGYAKILYLLVADLSANALCLVAYFSHIQYCICIVFCSSQTSWCIFDSAQLLSAKLIHVSVFDLQRTGGRQSSRRSWVICEQSLHAPRESCWKPRVRTRSVKEFFEAKLCREVCSLLAALLRNHPIVFLRHLCSQCFCYRKLCVSVTFKSFQW